MGIYYPIGLFGGSGGDKHDVAYKDGADPASLLQFRRGHTGEWERSVQRKGQDYYIAAQGSDNTMVGIQSAKVTTTTRRAATAPSSTRCPRPN